MTDGRRVIVQVYAILLLLQIFFYTMGLFLSHNWSFICKLGLTICRGHRTGGLFAFCETNIIRKENVVQTP